MSPIMKDPVWTKRGTDGAFILLSVIYFFTCFVLENELSIRE